MAKRTQAGAATGKPSYEEFEPMFEWREQEENNLLIVHLPDFTKEQIRISCVRSSRVIRIQGERQLADKKWSRVNQAFPIPQNCNIDKISASWQDEVITVTLPKITVTKQIAPKEEAKMTAPQEAPVQPKAPAAGDQPKPSNNVQEAALPKATATISTTTNSGKATSSDVRGQKQADGRGVEASSAQKPEAKPQKGKDETPPQVASTANTTKHTERKSESLKAENIKQLGKKEGITEANAKPAESEKAGDVTEKSLVKEKESSIRGKEFTAAETVVSKTTTTSVDKEKVKRDISADGKEKRVEISSASAKAKEMKNTITAATMKAMKALTTEKSNEERQLMVNIGVAVLVIVALGGYLSYSFASKSKD